MPFDRDTTLTLDIRKDGYANQYASLLLSDKGRVIWCDRQAKFEFTNGLIRVTADAPVEVSEAGGNLREAFRFASKKYFPPSGKTPDLLFFSAPQYNTWIELTYNQNEKDILAYADSMLENGLPPGILMIDDTWQYAYGVWEFDPRKFSDPKGMVAKLHSKGFKVILWMCPWVGMDTPAYRLLTTGIDPFKEGRFPKGGLMIDRNTGRPAADRWWNGVSALLDFTHPRGREWFKGELDRLVADYGVDGFKLDECDSSDNTGSWSFPLHAEFPSGLDGEQYHSLFGTLYAKTILDALDDTPTLSEIRQMGALAAPYPFVLYSDLYDHKDFLRGVANSGFSGILWTPEFRDAPNRDICIRRVQAIVFSVQCLINAWYYDGIPWVGHGCEDEVRELLKLREKLVPMLKKAFEDYHTTGKPPVRALVMDYTDDRETYKIDDQWLFCDDLLVAPIAAGTGDERDVYLPVSAKWVDYFTGEPVESGWHHVNTKGIPVYKRV
jgi:alpha-glucosidase (family GH31 glycosyl hydrolase)